MTDNLELSLDLCVSMKYNVRASNYCSDDIDNYADNYQENNEYEKISWKFCIFSKGQDNAG